MPKALATYFATVNDMPDTEFKVEILEDEIGRAHV